ncbi:MAG TPA: sensor histidine kinase [Anaerolineae bacterium]|nr:sensor histidine kinase [Anaerolineae bacterium]HQH37947.1 sensor histidine kinase [Anaerolineae bacterium]
MPVKTLRRWFAVFWDWLGLQKLDVDPDIREVRVFFIIVTLVLGGSAILAVNSQPALRAPARLIPFVILLAVHIAFYWLSPAFMLSPRRTVGFLVAQAILIFVITLFSRDFSMILSLYPALLGLAVGMLHEKRRIAAVIIVWLVLATLNLILVLGFSVLPTWLMFAPPLTLFVVIYVVLYIRQVEARDHARKLLRELEVAHRDLADHAARIEELTLAAERQRMARELHDTLAQGVAGLILQLEAADSHLTQGRAERAQSIVQQAMARARATLADARRAIDDLRVVPSAADLADALRHEVTRFTEATGLPCTLDLMLPDSVSGDVCEHIVQIVSEGLTNVARHARAQHVWIDGKEAEGWLVIEIRDDGVGLNPAAALTQAGHYGLIGMRERTHLAGGTLEIASVPGNGTRLTLRLPLSF